ncbi:MAG TPA: hypothetical protein VHN79_05685, partial [Lacunisphaera sp.]|nr:hypothetical protein [Lacunisphaera sp.]
AVHELLTALERSGLDHYALPDQLLGLFQRMQEFQIRRTEENRRLGIRRHARKPSLGNAPVAAPAGPKRRRIFPQQASEAAP